jgi:hypothetical protein
MSRPKPKTPVQIRVPPGSVTAAIAGLTPKCNATIVELPNGPLILMACPAAAGCPRRADARRRQRPPEPELTMRAVNATSMED